MLYLNSDQANVQVELTDDAEVALDISGYASIELYLVDSFGQVQAKYVHPLTDQTGYHALRLPSSGILEFDIYKEDSINFRPGPLYANILLVSPTSTDFPSGEKQRMNGIYIEEVGI
jgi:hypothetical protein